MDSKTNDIGVDSMRNIEKQLLLGTIDGKWRDHLVTLEHLRSVVGIRSHAQRDPLNEYKTESFELFEIMLESLRTDITKQLAHVQKQTPEQQRAILQQQIQNAIEQGMDIEDIKAQVKEAYGIDIELQPAPEDGFNPEDPDTWPPLARNDRCLCGSGKKYKHCHGAHD